MPKTSRRVIASSRRACKFLAPAHEDEAARAASFKRAIELCEWAMSEFIKSGRDDAAYAAWDAIDAAEVPPPAENPQEEFL